MEQWVGSSRMESISNCSDWSDSSDGLFVLSAETAFGEPRYEDETRAALAEMNKLFRHLFPLVPDKAHYIWKSSHVGGALTLDQPQHRTTYIEHIESPSLIRSHSPTPQSEISPHIREDQQQYDDVADGQDVQDVPVSAATQATPVLSPILAKNFDKYVKSGRRMQTTPLGKRGPECMRKCIAQGVLHPVQCHSLC